MGEFKFRLPVDWPLDPYHANSIHIVGLDGVPWPCRISIVTDTGDAEKIVSVTRNQTESGKLYVLFDCQGRGEHLICTGTLPPDNDEPYDLMTELARGTLNRLRNQISNWYEGGLEIDDGIFAGQDRAVAKFREAVFAKSTTVCQSSAKEAVDLAVDTMFRVADVFTEQISAVRLNHPKLSNFWVANQIGRGPQADESFNATFSNLVVGDLSLAADDGSQSAQSGFGGRPENTNARLTLRPAGSRQQFEACDKRVIIGPLLDASIGGMSHEALELPDFQTRKKFVLDQAERKLANLPGNVSMIHAVAGINGTGHRLLSYPQQLQTTVDLLAMIGESSVGVPAMVSFDFPWAERLAGAVGGVHPLQIADGLLRQGVEVGFVGLDLNLDYWPNGSAVRDPFQWIDLIDNWAQFGLPLVLNLRVPILGSRQMTQDTGSQNSVCSNLNDRQRIDFLRTVLPMLVARPTVHGIVFAQWQDQDDERYPCAGLVDANGSPKLIVEAIKAITRVLAPLEA